MHDSVKKFLARVLSPARVAGKRVLEVGSFNVNGSAREVGVPLEPARWHGVDLQAQAGFVDEVLDAGRLVERFGAQSWDVVVSCEMLEHAEDWEAAVANMRDVLVPGGLLVLSARGPGFPVHAYPWDHWRFTTEDVAAIFADFTTLHLSDDPQDPGFFFAGLKPGGEPLVAAPSPVVVPPHTREWHDGRLAARMAVGVVPEPFACFYHVACMGHWREVVREQMALLERVGVKPRAFVLGSAEDAEWVAAQGIEVLGRDERLDLYELPTLQAAYEWARVNPTGAVLYLHTKGVSAPGDPNKRPWRELMMEALVGCLPHNLALLTRYDMVGVDWQNSPTFPHYSGNFWLARADWLASLDDPATYQASRTEKVADQPWRRMFAEMWLGSRPWHAMKSLVCSDRNLWRGDDVFRILEEFRARRGDRETAVRLVREEAGSGASVFLFGCDFPSWVIADDDVGPVSGIDRDGIAIELSRALIPGFAGEVVSSYDGWFKTVADVVVACGALETCCNGAAEQILYNLARRPEWRTLIVTSTKRPRGNGDRGRVRPWMHVPYDVEDAMWNGRLALGEIVRRITGANGSEFLVFKR